MRLTNFEAAELGEALLNAAERAARDNKTIGIICVNGLMICIPDTSDSGCRMEVDPPPSIVEGRFGLIEADKDAS